MAKLVIEVRYLSMLVHTGGGLSILLPSEGHTCSLRLASGGKKLALQQADVTILRDGRALWGTTVKAARESIVPPLRKIAGVAAVHPRPSLVGSTCPAALNARLFVAGGEVDAKNPVAFPTFKKVKWHFKQGGKTIRSQVLTDVVEYTLELEKGSRYEIAVDGKPVYDVSKGAAVIIANENKPGAKKQSAPPYTLDEFAIIYKLLDGKYSGLPIPVATNAPKIAPTPKPGPDRPMCSPTQT